MVVFFLLFAVVVDLFERSEFLIDTSQKKVCACARVHVCSTNLGFSVGYVLCASYVCTWYQPADHTHTHSPQLHRERDAARQRAAATRRRETVEARAERCVCDCLRVSSRTRLVRRRNEY